MASLLCLFDGFVIDHFINDREKLIRWQRALNTNAPITQSSIHKYTV